MEQAEQPSRIVAVVNNQHLLRSLLLLGLALIAYFPSLATQQFVAVNEDDEAWLAFTHPPSIDIVAAPIWPETYPLWRPTVIAYFAVLQSLFGQNPFPFRLVSVLTLAATSIVIYRMLRAWLDDDKIALLASIVFLTRASHAWTVWWSSSSGTLFAGLFGMLSTAAFFHFIDTDKPLAYLGALAACILSLLSKEEAIVLPLLIWLSILLARRPAQTRHLVLTLPFWLAAVAGFVIRYRFLSAACCLIVDPINPGRPLELVSQTLRASLHGIAPLTPTMFRFLDNSPKWLSALRLSGSLSLLALAGLVLICVALVRAIPRQDRPELIRQSALLVSMVVIGVLPLVYLGFRVVGRYVYLASIAATFLLALWVHSYYLHGRFRNYILLYALSFIILLNTVYLYLHQFRVFDT